ncbi:PDR/VanB family oxidoreductase [[Enterobacter] lignolyticus]|uniref:Carnitine monooxygenase reductase subunit n=1 Tax=Enterobacter lignolyticus (strain SCF1) TaxID=701347 RepID=E3GD38_ENTLS|nr:PDR/VanB family oxidoreductase [[Enterobacter] lignolyticus]ADO49057.1 ferredoxin [[Enterobacter] lignolyticus SCF1]
MSDYQMIEVVVRNIEIITPLVKRFTFARKDNQPLPPFRGGSHIIVQMQNGEQRYSNAYSLMSSPFDTSVYQIAVRLEEDSKGGSRFMHHHVQPGDTLTISAPNNLFAISPQAAKHLLIAGGIGITPFLSYLPELERAQGNWALHYCFHHQENNAFQDELIAGPWRDRINFYVSEQGTRLDLARLLADVEPGTHIYTCGPAALNDAVKTAAGRMGIADEQLHFEQFAIENKGGAEFTLVLSRSGREFIVPEDKTILQIIENNKAAKVECLCREGVCGTCETTILEGEADHRDQYFSIEEQNSQKSMLICCSRAKSKRLVLDL